MPSDFAVIADRLFNLRPQGGKFGIDRMRVLAAALDHPERRTPCIHVAGTNGKGSVAAMLESILRAAGWRTGLYTSPHLVHLGERVQVDRRPLTEDEIVAYFEELRPHAAGIAAANPEDRPSFFEYMTAMAFLQFARRQCDVAILEVGLGGRLDATNIVQPQVSVVTSIGLDHTELLGGSLEQIATEKAGIVKPGAPVVLGRMPSAAETTIRRIAAQLGVPLMSVTEMYGGGTDDRLPRTNLEGEYQRWNAATATVAARALGARWRITPDAIDRGLGTVNWPGRWQRVRVGGRLVVLDASHNPEGAEALDANLARLVAETGRAPVVIVGVMGVERARPLMKTICRHAQALCLVVPDQPRACGHEELEALVPASYRGAVVRDTVVRLFPEPDSCRVDDAEAVVVVTGSIYLLGEVIKRLGGSAK